jgi:NAD(P)-dependent dehydrogenase (short-subunit alcohol dehydrogenase family)
MAILVNAAGVSQNRLLVRERTETIDQIIDINLKGTILGCKAAAAAMIKQRRGCIINISSVLGIKGGQGASVYAASKAGVLGTFLASVSMIYFFFSLLFFEEICYL